MKTTCNYFIYLFCISVITACFAGCNLIADDEAPEAPPANLEKFFKIEGGVLVKYTGPGGDIVIPNGVTAIGDEVFAGKNVTSVVMPNTVESIAYWAFGSCRRLTSVTFSSALRYIEDFAFSECPALTSITLPSSVRYVKNSAFKDCTALTSVTLPKSLIGLSYELFSGCVKLRNLTVGWAVPVCAYWNEDEDAYLSIEDLNGVFGGVDKSGITLTVPSGVKVRYENAPLWKDFGNIVENPNDVPTENGITSTPEARSEFDNRNGGIYKGVLVGSTGTFKIVLQDGKQQAEAFFDGEPQTLFPSEPVNITAGQPVRIYFRSIDGRFSLVFSVDGDGQNPLVEAYIPDHPMTGLAVKETSTQLAEVYEGRYNGKMTFNGEEGTLNTAGSFNVIVQGNRISGLTNSDGLYQPYTLSGNINGTSLSATGNDGVSPPLNITGTLGTGTVSGNWSHSLPDVGLGSGTFSGKRMW
ncbi:MAG: leucine-rich repeat domain-containing protein [Tannerella sp.]|nr:leucine-rich repeat domain-containing protein [Tannerella sp.]